MDEKNHAYDSLMRFMKKIINIKQTYEITSLLLILVKNIL